MKPEILLNSRYGEDNRLIREGSEGSLRYKLQTRFNYRAGIIEDNPDEYSFIDPSGGPYITIGSEIDGHIVKSIHKGGIIEFES
jgi:hypothetical protein